MKLRRSLAAGAEEKKVKDKMEEGDAFRSEVEENGGQLIHLDEYRLQAIKNRPQYYSLENMSYEDLENLKAEHRAKLEELKMSYFTAKEKTVKPSIDKMLENFEGLTYEELAQIRVVVFLQLRNNMKKELER